MAAPAAPQYDEEELVDRSPALARLKRKRLAPSRWRDLLAAAGGAKPPKEPEPWECCGSSCKPCVLELHREEKKVWEEVHPDGVSDDEDADGDADKENEPSVPATAREADASPTKVNSVTAVTAEQRRATPVIEIELEKLGLTEGVEHELQEKEG
ncbi:hypothetical protein JCM10450v2_001460 [Rhodotorula kratochvilovae]